MFNLLIIKMHGEYCWFSSWGIVRLPHRWDGLWEYLQDQRKPGEGL